MTRPGLRADSASALRELAPWSTAQAALRDRFLHHLEHRADAFERSGFPAHFTAGTLIVSEDRRQVLLNHHRKARIWVAFGGHLDPGESFAEAAEREAREESGLTSFTMLPGIAQLSSHPVDFCHPGGVVDHLDVRYVATAEPAEPVVSDESIDVRWWPVGAVPTRERELLELIERAVGA